MIRRRGVEFQVPASDVVVGDLVIVRPGERIPVDGVVVAGESDVNQASVTGESFPAEKRAGDDVFAGRHQRNGCAGVDGDARGVRQHDRAHHPPRRGGTEPARAHSAIRRSFRKTYTPAVVFLAIAVAFLVPLAVAGPGGWTVAFPTWSYRALALLVVACPCALVISTPVSIVSALTAAARAGVLIKGGAHLERLGSITCVAFDKTGTLTEAQVTIAEVVGVDGALDARRALGCRRPRGAVRASDRARDRSPRPGGGTRRRAR